MAGVLLNKANIAQIYDLVNEVFTSATGNTALKALDTTGLVAMGETLLDSPFGVESFTNTLVQRIGRVIMVDRAYTNNLKVLMYDDFEYGAVVQKVDVEVPDAVEDESLDLTDGDSVDMYVISKPKPVQSFFNKRSTSCRYITIQRKWIKDAFRSAGDMASFIAMVFTKIRNKMELTMENLGKLTMATFATQSSGTQVRNMVTEYNTKLGKTLTPGAAYYDADFLRFLIGELNLARRYLTEYSTLYNKEGALRHTPYDRQIYVGLAEIETAMNTQMLYGAYHDQYLRYIKTVDVGFWQNEQSRSSMSITFDGDTQNLENVIGILFDREAMGTFRHEEDVLTTPVNARGRYYNTFWFEDQIQFCDFRENGIVFTLN